MSETAHVITRSRCAHCGSAVELECEGLPGFWGYPTYNEYFCPHCRKQNHTRSTGAVISTRLVTNDPEEYESPAVATTS
jgi:hypothetical protein